MRATSLGCALVVLGLATACRRSGDAAERDGATGTDATVSASRTQAPPPPMLPSASAPHEPRAKAPEPLAYIDSYGLTYPLPAEVDQLILAGSKPAPEPVDTVYIPRVEPSCPSLGEVFVSGPKPIRKLCVLPLSRPDAPLDSCAMAGCSFVLVGGSNPALLENERAVARVDDPTWERLAKVASHSRKVCVAHGRIQICPPMF
jgi:hypothetical protein